MGAAGAVICDYPARRPNLNADSGFCFSPSSNLGIISIFFFFFFFVVSEPLKMDFVKVSGMFGTELGHQKCIITSEAKAFS